MRIFSFLTLIFTTFVIIWGALVRASNSGAGCGQNWPLCNNELIPADLKIETMIELTHRITSGTSFILVFILFILIRKHFPKKSLPETTARYAFIFILIEVLIGALIVLFGWVKDDSSNFRILMVGFHLINSFLLIGSLALNFYSLCLHQNIINKKVLFIPSNNYDKLCVFLFLTTASLGAVTALGDTLFPLSEINYNFFEYLSGKHILTRLRIFHPLIAIMSSFVIIGLCFNLISKYRHIKFIYNVSILIIMLIILQIVTGLLTIVLFVPLILQLLHLTLSIILWILLSVLISEREILEY